MNIEVPDNYARNVVNKAMRLATFFTREKVSSDQLLAFTEHQWEYGANMAGETPPSYLTQRITIAIRAATEVGMQVGTEI